MFLEEVADLKDRYPDRFQLVPVLSREERQAGLPSGRLDEERLAALLPALLPVGQVDGDGAAQPPRRPLRLQGRGVRNVPRLPRPGEVRMNRNFALESEETDAGYVLACQSHPVTERVELDFDR
ncbi:2Fe-2S iron-sulfur cluster-binding protein [Streptomyces hirsutus]